MRPGSRSTAVALLGVLTVVVALFPPSIAGQGLIEDLRRGIRSQAAFSRGKAFYDAGDYERARERFVEALSLDGYHDEARALLGWSQHFLGEHKAAIISFKAAIRRQPGWEGLHDGLGWSRFHLKRYHLAAEAFRAALDLNPDFADARIGLGSALFELSRYDEALANLQAAARQVEPLIGARRTGSAGARSAGGPIAASTPAGLGGLTPRDSAAARRFGVEGSDPIPRHRFLNHAYS